MTARRYKVTGEVKAVVTDTVTVHEEDVRRHFGLPDHEPVTDQLFEDYAETEADLDLEIVEVTDWAPFGSNHGSWSAEEVKTS